MGIKKDGFNIDSIKYGSYDINSLFFGLDLIWKKKSADNLRLVFSDTFNRANSSITRRSIPDVGTYYGSFNSRIVDKAYSPDYGNNGHLSVKINIPFIISAEVKGASRQQIGLYNIASQNPTNSLSTDYAYWFFIENHTVKVQKVGYSYILTQFTIPVEDRKPIYTISIKIESDFSYFYVDDKLIYTANTNYRYLSNINTGINHNYCYGEGWLDNLQIWEYDEE